MKFKDAIVPDIRGGCSLFHVETTDQLALTASLQAICGSLGYSLFRWGPASGIEAQYITTRVTKDTEGRWLEEPQVMKTFNQAQNNRLCSAVDLTTRMVTDPSTTNDNCDALIPKQSVIIAMMLDDFFNNAVVRQNVIDGIAFSRFSQNKIRLIMTGASLNIHPQVLMYSTPLTLELPEEDELLSIAQDAMNNAAVKSAEKYKEAEAAKDKDAMKWYSGNWFCEADNATTLVPHLKGLTAFRARRAMIQAVVRHAAGTVDNVVQYISDYKMQVVENSKVLRFLPYNEQEDENSIGGFDNLLSFMRLRRDAFTEEARKQNIDTPKGVVLLGRPGTGKSLAAKAMGKMLGDLPVIVMDVGSLFGSLVGESEARVREALKIIDSINGCVLLIDEADKAFAGNNSGTSGDSGTSQRVLGSVLNWLNDHKSKTFVVLTLNRLDTLPPELLRAGRFDKIFYTDLPTPAERRTILEIHLRKRLSPINEEVTYSDDEWTDILCATSEFVGAELEEVVKEARLRAFQNSGHAIPSASDLIFCAENRTPMARSNAIKSEIMTECKKIAEPVSGRPYKPELDD